MKKLALATIIISISMSLVGCNNATNSTTENNINEKLTVDQAKEIALQHANLTIDQVSFIRTESEIDNGIEKYNIEFYSGNTEYDYEIDAANGNILEYDQDVENYNIQQPINTDTVQITIEEAKDIALKNANLTNDQVTFTEVKLDIENGIQKYELEFYNNNKEYSYEIDANTGKILSYEQD